MACGCKDVIFILFPVESTLKLFIFEAHTLYVKERMLEVFLKKFQVLNTLLFVVFLCYDEHFYSVVLFVDIFLYCNAPMVQQFCQYYNFVF